MRFRGTLLAATFLAAPLGVQAQPFRGFYIGAGAGYNYRGEIDMKDLPYFPFRTSIQGNSGFGALGSAGYGFGNGLRLELEGNYRQSSIQKITGTPFPATAGGQISTYGVMANALFDMDVGFPWIYPYLGVGAGYAWTNVWRGYDNSITSLPSAMRFSGTEANFAFQAIAGLSFPVPRVPGLSITAEYRFFGVFGNDPFGARFFNGPFITVGHATLRNEFNHSILGGIRYAFGITPPPSAAPAVATQPPAVQPARSYLVFFDWDKATLTDHARQIVREAAENSKHVQYTRIAVNGYTDTSGSTPYNMRLSIRRAQAVAAELVHDGVPREAISIHGFGETHLLVPTGNGVREPQNRRVEIIIE